MSGAGDLRQRVEAVKARVALSALIGRAVKLRQRGREWSGLCPFHQERSPSFTVNDDKDFYHCFGCGAHGDAIGFVMAHEGVEFGEALKRLEADAGLASESAVRRASIKPQGGGASDLVDGKVAAATVWREAQPARGSLVERWLEARGIDPAASGALDVIRFHPRCPGALWRRWESPADARRISPAMVAPILRVHGGPGERALSLCGVHVTLLAGDGRGKAQFQPWQDRRTGEWVKPATRLMWGAAARGAVLLPGMRLPEGADGAAELVRLLDAPGVLLVGEGIESTLSLAARTRDVRLACATLSLGNLEGVPRRVGKQAAVPLWNLKADPELGRAFTVEAAGPVVIGVDADMKPTQPLWVQERRGAPLVKRALSGRERSERCAALAHDSWRQAGAWPVRVERPPMGCDFNDLDQGGRQ